MKTNIENFEDLFRLMNSFTPSIKYHTPLPPTLAKWYCYHLDGGHSIYVLLKQFVSELKNNPNNSFIDYIIPCPVKTVLRGFTVSKEGYIIVEGLDYDDEIGLIFSEDDCEYSVEDGVNLIEENSQYFKNDSVIGENNGFESLYSQTKSNLHNPNEIINRYNDDEIIETNYYNSTLNLKGLFYLEYNRKCFHLMIPSAHLTKVEEIKTGNFVVLTTGLFNINRKEMVELMFEDYSSSPFCIHLSLEQLSFIMGENFNKKKFKIKVYSEKRKVIELDAFVRSDRKYWLPYLRPINKRKFHEG